MKTLLFGIFLAFLANSKALFAAEAGMPQLDSKYWASQGFWLVLVFVCLYLAMANFFIPKIKNNLNNRDSKIKNDLDEAKKFKDESEKRQKEYEVTIDKAKKQVQKILSENKNKLNLEIQKKRRTIENEIEKEIQKAQKEIILLKKESVNHISKISEEVTAKVIEEISGDKLNESSIKAAVLETSKSHLKKYL